VVGRWEGGGTNTGAAWDDFLVGSLPADTGRAMRFTGTTVLRIENGKIVEEIGLDDGVKARGQLGRIKQPRAFVPHPGDRVTALILNPQPARRDGEVLHVGIAPAASIGVRLDVVPGDSGSPVFDADGDFVGLVRAVDGSGTTLLTPASVVLAFLEAPDVV
jgi:hypothetical protein